VKKKKKKKKKKQQQQKVFCCSANAFNPRVIQSIAADHDQVTLIGSLGFWYKQPWDGCTRVDKQIIPES
jgi:arginine exporter protein ArgO